MFNENVFPFFLSLSLSQPAKINSRQSKFAHATTVNKISPRPLLRVYIYIYIGNSVDCVSREKMDGRKRGREGRRNEMPITRGAGKRAIKG